MFLFLPLIHPLPLSINCRAALDFTFLPLLLASTSTSKSMFNRRTPRTSTNRFLVIAPADFVGLILAVAYLATALFGFLIQSIVLADYGKFLSSATKPFIFPVAAVLWAADINN